MKKPFKSEHIFQTILKDMQGKKMSIDDKMDAISLYYSCETLLQNSRKRNKNISKYQQENLIREYNEINQNLKQHLGIIFYPACAYYEFIFGDLLLSEKHITKTLRLINKIEHIHSNYVLAKIEQSINLCRIFKLNKKYTKYRALAEYLCQFIETGQANKMISHSPLFKEVPKSELIAFKEYFSQAMELCN